VNKFTDGLYIGLISGTSADGIDAALVSFRQHQPELVCSHLEPFPADLRQRLTSLFTPGANQIDLLGQLDVELGQLFAQASLNLLSKSGVTKNEIAAIGSHGQTVRHRPTERHPFTLQIADPHYIAEITGIDVIADFRRRDMVLDGQGAPLAPAFHEAFLGHASENRVILNVGGIANITYLPAANVEGALAMDTGPANGLMDAWIQRRNGFTYDQNGAWASSGKVIHPLLENWLQDPYFKLSAPKSTGKEYFHLAWAEKAGNLTAYAPEDIQASFLELSATSIANAIAQLATPVDRVLACGGGVRNSALMARLQHLIPCRVQNTGDYGIPPDWVEAMAFAWFAKNHLQRIKLDLSAFTGAQKPVLMGSFFPAS